VLRAEGITSRHWVSYATEGGRAFVLTGVVHATMQGGAEAYNHDQLHFKVPVPGIPRGQQYKLRRSAPFATLNSIASDGGFPNPAWAVDGFSVRFPNVPIPSGSALLVSCDLAVRGDGVFILRVGYVINLVGSFQAIPGSHH
jgi:hypothetical protein